MKIGWVVGLLFIGLGCSGGMTEEQVVDLIRERSAENTVELRQYVDGEVNALEGQMVDGFLAQRQYMVEQILGVEKFMNDAEVNIREVARAEGASNFAEVERVAEDMLATVQRNTELLVRAVCETDYWAMTALSMANALGNHLEGDGTTLEEVDLFLYGIVIGQDYGDVSAVCRVDADGRWALIKQPDKILPDRRG